LDVSCKAIWKKKDGRKELSAFHSPAFSFFLPLSHAIIKILLFFFRIQFFIAIRSDIKSAVVVLVGGS
jgi:hypothetical protein